MLGVASALVLGTVALGAGPAVANGNGGNVDCLAGETEIKFDSGSIGGSQTVSGFTATVSDVKTGDFGDDATPTVTTGNNILSIDYTASEGLVALIVKGGPTAVVDRAPVALTGNDITAGINPNNQKPYGVSNVVFCFATPPAPTVTASPTATAGPSGSASPTASASPTVSVSPSSTEVSPTPSATSASPNPSSTSAAPAPSETSVAPSSTATPTTTISPSPTVSPSTIGGTGGGGGTTVDVPVGPVVPSVTPIDGGDGGPSTDGETPVIATPISGGEENPATGPTGAEGQPSALPFTGYELDTAVLAAWASLLAGALMVFLGRRRRSITS